MTWISVIESELRDLRYKEDKAAMQLRSLRSMLEQGTITDDDNVRQYVHMLERRVAEAKDMIAALEQVMS